MNKRPIAVTIIAILLMLVGVFSIVGDWMNFKSLSAEHYQIVWIAAVHLLAIVAAVFLLRGENWARWVAVAWMAFHVAISYPALVELMIHTAFLLLFAWFLFFTTDARAWFRGRDTAM